MSKFRVKLKDMNGATNQRTLYVEGPKGIRRYLKNGDEFEDSNYWKRFAYPSTSAEEAFIEILEDDGSIYSEVEEENNFPRVYNLTVSSSIFDDNKIDIFKDNNSFAKFVQIHCIDGEDLKVRINGSSEAVFDLPAGSTQQFDYGDIAINRLEFSNEGSIATKVQVILSVKYSFKS